MYIGKPYNLNPRPFRAVLLQLEGCGYVEEMGFSRVVFVGIVVPAGKY